MVQTLVVYLAVGAAAAWVVWSMLLPRSLKARLRRGRPARSAGKDDGCACGKGGRKD